MPAPADQFRHLRSDLATSVNGRWWRWLSVPWQAGALSIIGYRLSRAAWLGLGRPYQVIHTLLAPVQLLLRPFGAGLEIHSQADIGPGLQVLHPNLGVVVSGHAVIGRALVLTGGNCIGSRPGTAGGDLTIGDGVTLGDAVGSERVRAHAKDCRCVERMETMVSMTARATSRFDARSISTGSASGRSSVTAFVS